MKHADLMTAAQRKGCLQAMNEPAHRYLTLYWCCQYACPRTALALTCCIREPFSKLEIRAQVSFVFDNPTLPLQSRKTWEQFRKETGSKRAADSLKSVCNSIAFLRCRIPSLLQPSSVVDACALAPANPGPTLPFTFWSPTLFPI
jgi:hypothetical protein